MNRLFYSTFVAAILWTGGGRLLAQDVGFFAGTTYKIVQLTGDYDYTRRIPTVSRTYTNAHLTGTDLGSTFEHNRRLHFLFGDTFELPDHNGAGDVLAWNESSANHPEEVQLGVFKDGDWFHRISIPGVSLEGFEIPSAGISTNAAIYVVATTDHEIPPGTTMGRSVMAVSHDNGRNFAKLYDLSTSNFINVSMVEVDGRDFPGVLPGIPCVLIWGSGTYRASDVRLAYVPSAEIGNPNKMAIRYLGLPGTAPVWSANEAAAVPLFDQGQPQIGEFSVAYCPTLAQWIMLYNYGPEIHMRSSTLPWGPWSVQPIIIFDPTRDKAYSNYLHVPDRDVISDQPYFSPAVGGNVYGPYLIPRFFEGDQNRVKIVYAMSTWNPYQVILTQSDIGYPDRVPEADVTTVATLPGSAGWTVFPSNFLRGSGGPGTGPYVTTHGDNGDADMGVAQYGFFCTGCDDALEFTVHGGDAEVVLIEQTQDVPSQPSNMAQLYTELKEAQIYGPVVETVIGPQSITDPISVRWGLRRHRGKMLRLVVIDKLNEPWGFITVSEVRRLFVPGSAPVDTYVDVANVSPPFLGTRNHPFATVGAAYNAATDCGCGASLIIRTGTYPEVLTLSKPVVLNADGGAAVISP